MKRKISCVIVTYNIGRKLKECFYSIFKQVDEVIIVDNGSNRETIEYLNELEQKHKIIVLFNKENMGIAQALNRGCKYAIENGCDWIITMDNDSQATENMVKSMLEVFDKLSEKEKLKIGSLFPIHVEKKCKDMSYKESKIISSKYTYIDVEITSGNMIKREVFEKVGYFDEKLFIDYVDFDYCSRIDKNKFKLIKIEEAVLLHSLGEIEEKNFLGKNISYTNHSVLRRYYITRNRFYVWDKYDNIKEFIKRDKEAFLIENIKIILFEKEKYKKIKMSYMGYRDYKENKFGKLEY